jgi:pyruvate formate lyase activating enzyme
MIIDGFEKLTLVNYPGNVACIVFTKGCNFKCPFCQNGSLVLVDKKCGNIDEKEIFDYLEKRKGLLDGICISGGEPLLQKDIKEFIKKIKDLGYKIKLDTNGSKPDILEDLINNKLLDYVAMDIKNSFNKYYPTIDRKNFDISLLKKSIDILKKSDIDYEFRTTIVKELHTFEDIKEICEYIGNKDKYFLQNFVDGDSVIKKGLHSFNIEEINEILDKLKKDFPNLKIR